MGSHHQAKPALDVIDAPLLRVPFESLKRAAKERKALVDEAGDALAAAVAAAVGVTPSGGGGGAAAMADGDGACSNGAAAAAPTAQQQLAQLDALVAKLQGLKRKLADVSRQEADEAARCRARLEHLQLLGPPPHHGVVAWNQRRLDRMLVDHMLRSGAHESAARLAAATGGELLSDAHIFGSARDVVAALRARDCGPALAWCADNRARLRRARSALEFRLRLQGFVELVRRGRRLEAVAYARAHLAPWAATHMRELQRALACLAFPAATRVPRYAALFADAAWDELRAAFLQDLYRLHGVLPEGQLAVHLHAGLVALKNAPGAGGSSREDPLAHPDLRALAAPLPYAKHGRSKLVCAVTRELMTDANPPVVLPNGYVYSQHAVDAIAARNSGRVVCPRTGDSFAYEDARRAYIV